jgi:hypothetical protein
MRKPLQRSAARISAAYISLSTARSPKACGMTLVRRRSSPNNRSSMLVVRITRRCASGKRRWGIARFKVVLQVCQRRRQDRAIGRHHVVAQQPRERRRGGLVAGNGARLELRPLILRHLALQIAQLVGEAALPRRAREAFLDRADQVRRAVGNDQQWIATISSRRWG